MERNTIIAAIIISLLLTILVFIHYGQISKRPGTIIIPAGNTYLGPSTPAPDVPWHDIKGQIFPYAFSAPKTLTLITFPNDRYDIYAIDCCNIDPGSNVLIGVDTLKENITQSKLTYVQNWWKQFGGLKSVASIDQFTNGKGLKGYKAKYVNMAGETPNLDVFFEIPDEPQFVIHMASGTLDADTFAKIIDSVAWENK